MSIFLFVVLLDSLNDELSLVPVRIFTEQKDLPMSDGVVFQFELEVGK